MPISRLAGCHPLFMNPLSGIVALRDAISTGRATADAALHAAFERAHAAQPRLKAFSYLPPILQAATVNISAPLAGIAVAVKDVMDTADMPTAYGSPIHRGHFPPRDAWVVGRLRDLGAHVLGKSVTTEFAWRHPGETVNPWNPLHTPGGSSSGSAAAVAAGIVPLALGTQTLGSVIRPAAYCGIVGFKPTFGAIPRTGVCPLAGSLDHVGLFAREVGDIAYVVTLLAGTDAQDVHGQPLQAFAPTSATNASPAPPGRIGMLRSALSAGIDPAQDALMKDVATRFEQAGAEVGEVDWPPGFEDASELAVAIVAYEAARIHADRMRRFPQLLSSPIVALIEQGRATSEAAYCELKTRQYDMQQAFSKWRQACGIDLVLLPPATGEAPKGLGYTGDPRLCSPMTLLGVPAIALPAGWGPNGLPLGVQLVGGRGEDAALLGAARWCEAVIAHPVTFPSPPSR